MPIRVEKHGPVHTLILARPQRRNAIDRDTAEALLTACIAFDADDDASIAILWGEGGHFCSGADLHAIAGGTPNRLEPDGAGPLGPTRLRLSKPVIAAIEGYAVAGGLELAAWCDLRVAAESAILGVYCRRFGVPLIDGGTVRLPQIVGLGRAMDLILTGRGVKADEALAMGLVSRVVPDGSARAAAEAWAHELAGLPQACLRADRASVYGALGCSESEGIQQEFQRGVRVLPEATAAAGRFSAGAGRHGG